VIAVRHESNRSVGWTSRHQPMQTGVLFGGGERGPTAVMTSEAVRRSGGATAQPELNEEAAGRRGNNAPTVGARLGVGRPRVRRVGLHPA